MIDWFDSNFLHANPNKFQAIIFVNNKPESIKRSANINVQTTNVIKLLGVYIDKELNFNYHISGLCNKVGKKINALARLSNTFDAQCKRLIYESCINCDVKYCPVVWNYCHTSDTKK